MPEGRLGRAVLAALHAAAPVVEHQEEPQLQRRERDLSILGDVIANNSTAALTFDDPGAAYEAFARNALVPLNIVFFVYNALDLKRFRWEGDKALSPGKHTLKFDFTYAGPGFGKGGSGVLTVASILTLTT